eukprot:scaffold52461_cov36-Cyclotella_meneghiniana.AAC.1
MEYVWVDSGNHNITTLPTSHYKYNEWLEKVENGNHNITTLPTSHYKYNEWLEKVEIGIWALKCSPQRVFQTWVGSKLAYCPCLLFT